METTANNHNFTVENGGKRKTYRKVRINQIIFIEYEKPKENGHLITAVDSYRNVVGRILEKYNEQSGKLEYVGCDHEGNAMFKSGNIESVKLEFIKKKEILMEQAYQRRLAKIKAMREQGEKSKTKEQVKTIGQKPQQNMTKQITRAEELKNLREEKSQDKSQELSR